MKRVITLLAIATFFMATLTTKAQNSAPNKNLNIGYTNVAYLLQLLPESKAVEQELKEYSQQLEAQLKSKTKNLQEKYEAYQRGQATMADAIKADKEREIMDLQKQIEEFRQNADMSLREKEAKLLEPITKKISEAINTVADKQGYDYIFNSDAGLNTSQILLYAPDDKNVTEEVLKVLGVELPADNQE